MMKMKQQEEKLFETLAALAAASRLTEQIDIKESLVSSLKQESEFILIYNGFRFLVYYIFLCVPCMLYLLVMVPSCRCLV